METLNTYPTIEEFIALINENASKPPIDIDLEKLGVNGVFVKNSMEEYLSKKGVSSSIVAKVLISTKAAKYEYDNQEDEVKEVTKDFQDLGTLIHESLLEPELFEKVKTEPNADLRTTEGTREMVKFYIGLRTPKPTYRGISKMGIKDLRAILKAERLICKHTIVTEPQKYIIEEIKKNYYEYGGGIIPQILKGAKCENSIYTQEPELLFEEKIRPDSFNIAENIGANVIVSLKSTSARSLEEFKTQAKSLKYGLKEGLYKRVMDYVTGRNFITVMIGLQTTPPYDVFLLFWNAQTMDVVTKEAGYYLEILNDAFVNGNFLGMESKAEEGNRGVIEFDLYGDYIPELPTYAINN